MDINTLAQKSPTPRDVLDALRDKTRHAENCLVADPEKVRFDATVEQWRDDFDLLPWDELATVLNEFWQMNIRREEWKSVLEPEESQTIQGVCELIASHAKVQCVRVPTFFGRPSPEIGVFFAARKLLSNAGADVSSLTPSSSIGEFALAHPSVFVDQISQLSPYRLPKLAVTYSWERFFVPWLVLLATIFAGFTITGLMSMTNTMLGVFVLFLCAMLLGATLVRFGRPIKVCFGDVETFRDLCVRLAAGIRT